MAVRQPENFGETAMTKQETKKQNHSRHWKMQNKVAHRKERVARLHNYKVQSMKLRAAYGMSGVQGAPRFTDGDGWR